MDDACHHSVSSGIMTGHKNQSHPDNIEMALIALVPAKSWCNFVSHYTSTNLIISI